MRRELNVHRPACKQCELLIELAQMPMPAALRVTRDILRSSGEEHVLLERTARARDAVLQVADDIVEIDHVAGHQRSEEHTSELQSLMRISYAVFCLKNK